MSVLQCGKRSLDLSRTVVMGILNITPDSFSDGGRFFSPESAKAQAAKMCAEGAAIIDVGAESTRPGAQPVSVQEELDRILPVVEGIVREHDVIVSVDTSTPEVMKEAAAVGAGFINDVRALQREGAIAAVVATGLPVCLMHMQGEPGTMQFDPHYENLFGEIGDFFQQRMLACAQAGIGKEKIVLDPGFGFGKNLEHNLALLNGLQSFGLLGAPVLAGLSRKSMLGKILGGADVSHRLYASISAAVIAAQQGARIIRVHDVAPTVEALALVNALHDQQKIFQQQLQSSQ